MDKKHGFPYVILQITFLVFAYTGDQSEKHKGISAFIVERTWEGFSSIATKGKLEFVREIQASYFSKM